VLALEKRLGLSSARILERHPTLSRTALREALKYAAQHAAEIADQIRSNEG